MGTRALIGLETADGKVTAVYCHHGSALLDDLRTFYEERSRVEQLIQLGCLSRVGKYITQPEGYPKPNIYYENDREQQEMTFAYCRDEGESFIEPLQYESQDTFKEGCPVLDAEYAYLFTKNDKWRCWKIHATGNREIK
jgi:hypothetical protein